MTLAPVGLLVNATWTIIDNLARATVIIVERTAGTAAPGSPTGSPVAADQLETVRRAGGPTVAIAPRAHVRTPHRERVSATV